MSCSGRHVLWLDGSFGSGKTTTAKTVLDARSDWLLVDPELVGFLLWEHDPSLRAQDFRGLRLWRRLVVEHVQAVVEERGVSVVVPMSLFDRLHVDETVGELRRRALSVTHVRLVAGADELRRRILAQRMDEDDETDAGIRAFRLGQLPAGLAAETGTALHVAGLSPGQVADAALRIAELD